MYRILLLHIGLLFATIAMAQSGKVGVNVAVPEDILHVHGGLLIEGDTITAGDVVGPVSRFQWFAGRYALRSGTVNGDHWVIDSMGPNSVAMGFNAKATNFASIALGYNVTASGLGSAAFGVGSIASNARAMAFGRLSLASGWNSTAFGNNTIASGSYSTAMGRYSNATGSISTTMGLRTIAAGFASTAIGMFNHPIVTPQGSVTEETPIFIVGIGDSDSTRANAMVVRKDGKVGIGTNSPDQSAILDISSLTAGVLLPRMTRSQRNAIPSPAQGLIIFNSETNCINYFTGQSWLVFCGECDALSGPVDAGLAQLAVLDSVELNASAPGLFESGSWAVVSGPGGSFNQIDDPSTVYHPNGIGTHVLQWLVTNNCLSDSANVTITIIDGIYVDKNFGGTPLGTKSAPFTDIGSAIILAEAEGNDTSIIVGAGQYMESLTLSNISFSLDILGGFAPPTWKRNIMGQLTEIQGSDTTVQIDNCGDVLFSGFTMVSSNAVLPGSSSYVILSTFSDLEVDSCILIATDGAEGLAGSPGSTGLNGSAGGNGDPGCEHSTSLGCDDCIPAPTGGSGGSGGGFGGGNGGNPGVGANSGSIGTSGVGNPGSAGSGVASGNGNSAPPFSAHGDPGDDGSTGSAGSGGSALGLYTASGYVATNQGNNGNSGGTGDGGGGGGGGGGGTDFCDSYGSGGGGGGSGGTGGGGGTAGQAGGGSFAIYAYNSALVISNTTIHSGNGGDGGDGGAGGTPGSGGIGGLSVYGTSGSQDDGSLGGNGGTGGDGGNGGQGGGGGGGPSIGIAVIGGSTLQQSNVVINMGNGGSGGDGSGGSGNGATGLSQTIH